MSAALIAIRNTDELGNVSVTATLQHIHCVSGALRKDDTHPLKRCTTSSLYHKAAIIEKSALVRTPSSLFCPALLPLK